MSRSGGCMALPTRFLRPVVVEVEPLIGGLQAISLEPPRKIGDQCIQAVPSQHDELLTQRFGKRLVSATTRSQGDHEDCRTLEQAGEEEGTVRQKRTMSEKLYAAGPLLIADTNAIREECDEFTPFDAGPDCEDGPDGGWVELDHPHTDILIQTLKDGVNHPGVVDEHDDI